jgi:hypothetical protein
VALKPPTPELFVALGVDGEFVITHARRITLVLREPVLIADVSDERSSRGGMGQQEQAEREKHWVVHRRHHFTNRPGFAAGSSSLYREIRVEERRNPLRRCRDCAADNIITANERIEIGLRTPRAMDFPAGMAQKESARSSCFASIRGFFLPACPQFRVAQRTLSADPVVH